MLPINLNYKTSAWTCIGGVNEIPVGYQGVIEQFVLTMEFWYKFIGQFVACIYTGYSVSYGNYLDMELEN